MIRATAILLLTTTPAVAGGWAEPVHPPERICKPFLFLKNCQPENPSPRITGDDRDDRPRRDNTPKEPPQKQDNPSDGKPSKNTTEGKC